MMKEEGESSINTEMRSLADDEIHVAEILLDFADLILARELGPGIKWGSRKMRSGEDDDEVDDVVEVYQLTDVVGVPRNRPETAAIFSPITPLSFSSTETDDNKTNSKFKSRKVYVRMIEEMSQCGDMLKKEVVKVGDYRNKLLAENSRLRAILQEEKLKLEKKRNENLAKNPEMGAAQLNNGLGSSNHVGPDGKEGDILPSLPLDEAGRSRCAEARRRRKDIMRFKSLRRAALKYSRT